MWINSLRNIATNEIVINDKQMEKTKPKDYGVNKEKEKDEEATENVKKWRKVSQGNCKQVNVL